MSKAEGETARVDNQNQRTITMIEELEHTVIDYERGIGYSIGIDEVIDKVNEIIRYLNEKEANK